MADTPNTLAVSSPTGERLSYGIPTITAVGDQGTGGANTATITAVAGQQAYLFYICVSYGATITSAHTLTVTDGVSGTVIWQARIPTITNPAPIVIDFQQRPLHSTTGNAIQVLIGTPGAAVPSTISISGFYANKP